MLPGFDWLNVDENKDISVNFSENSLDVTIACIKSSESSTASDTSPKTLFGRFSLMNLLGPIKGCYVKKKKHKAVISLEKVNSNLPWSCLTKDPSQKEADKEQKARFDARRMSNGFQTPSEASNEDSD